MLSLLIMSKSCADHSTSNTIKNLPNLVPLMMAYRILLICKPLAYKDVLKP